MNGIAPLATPASSIESEWIELTLICERLLTLVQRPHLLEINEQIVPAQSVIHAVVKYFNGDITSNTVKALEQHVNASEASTDLMVATRNAALKLGEVFRRFPVPCEQGSNSFVGRFLVKATHG